MKLCPKYFRLLKQWLFVSPCDNAIPFYRLRIVLVDIHTFSMPAIRIQMSHGILRLYIPGFRRTAYHINVGRQVCCFSVMQYNIYRSVQGFSSLLPFPLFFPPFQLFFPPFPFFFLFRPLNHGPFMVSVFLLWLNDGLTFVKLLQPNEEFMESSGTREIIYSAFDDPVCTEHIPHRRNDYRSFKRIEEFLVVYGKPDFFWFQASAAEWATKGGQIIKKFTKFFRPHP